MLTINAYKKVLINTANTECLNEMLTKMRTRSANQKYLHQMRNKKSANANTYKNTDTKYHQKVIINNAKKKRLQQYKCLKCLHAILAKNAANKTCVHDMRTKNSDNNC